MTTVTWRVLLTMAFAAGCVSAGGEETMAAQDSWCDGWAWRRALTVTERSGILLSDFPVSLELDGTDGHDLRVVIDGREVPSQVEDAGGGRVRLWFEVSLGAGATLANAFVYSGNSSAGPVAVGDWGALELGEGRAVLEGEALRAVYDTWLVTPENEQWETTIRELTDKRSGLNHCDAALSPSGRIDAAAGRFALDGLPQLVADGPVFRSIRLGWNEEPPEEQVVTVFRRSAFLRVDYRRTAVNSVDIFSTPGGRADGWECWCHGAGEWVSGYEVHERSYYNRFPKDGYNDVSDGGSLNANGQFIMAVYNEANGAGWGRVAPVESVSIIKLLRGGFELFTWLGGGKEAHSQFIFVFEGGPAGARALGLALANPPSVALGSEEQRS